MEGKCQLHNEIEDLRLSHIIPKFAFDYMKSTGSKYMRGIENPNIRLQDGPKEYLLCENAEQIFSKRERWFANNIFFPYLKDDKRHFNYDENLAYFSISILWRVLLNQIKHPSIENEKGLNFLTDVADEWRNFLLDYKYPYNFNNVNILFTDRVTAHNSELFNVDLYFSRIIDATIIHNENYTKIAVYVKFLRFVIWSVVKGSDDENIDTRIQFGKGELIIPQKINDEFITGFFTYRIKVIDNRAKLDEKQALKVQAEMKKVESEFWNTDAGKAMMNDYKNAQS